MKMLHGFSANKYEFLSNFYACDTFYKNELMPEGMVFKTAEHAFQAAKATTVEDMLYVAEAHTPGEAKKRGRTIKIRADWDTIKDNVMYTILKSKFTDDQDMWNRMMATAPEYDAFCEDNWWHDNYWGDCQCPSCKDIVGKNMLGKLLTKVRAELISDWIKNMQEMEWQQHHDEQGTAQSLSEKN